MSYCANGSGVIVCRSILETALVSKAKDILEAEFEVDADNKPCNGEGTIFYLSCCGNYHDDAIEATLDAVTVELRNMIDEGYVEFSGEDDAIWRYRFDNDHWVEESATVIYPTVSSGELIAKITSELDLDNNQMLALRDILQGTGYAGIDVRPIIRANDSFWNVSAEWLKNVQRTHNLNAVEDANEILSLASANLRESGLNQMSDDNQMFWACMALRDMQESIKMYSGQYGIDLNLVVKFMNEFSLEDKQIFAIEINGKEYSNYLTSEQAKDTLNNILAGVQLACTAE